MKKLNKRFHFKEKLATLKGEIKEKAKHEEKDEDIFPQEDIVPNYSLKNEYVDKLIERLASFKIKTLRKNERYEKYLSEGKQKQASKVYKEVINADEQARLINTTVHQVKSNQNLVYGHLTVERLSFKQLDRKYGYYTMFVHTNLNNYTYEFRLEELGEIYLVTILGTTTKQPMKPRVYKFERFDQDRTIKNTVGDAFGLALVRAMP
jgi:hypothetical protein